MVAWNDIVLEIDNWNESNNKLDLAIQFLKKRAVSPEKVKGMRMNQYQEVLPISELVSVLEMVKSGDFLNFYNKMKQQGHPDFNQPTNFIMNDTLIDESKILPTPKFNNHSREYQEILLMLDGGQARFEKGYFHTLGQMQRDGIIKADLYKEGYAIVRRTSPSE